MNRLITTYILIFILFLFLSSLLSAQPLTGSKTIGGPNPNYNTFTAAIADLTLNGVGDGGVVFNVRPGIYPERLEIHAISGASSANPIMFYSSGDSVILAPTGTSGLDAVVKLVGASHFWFDEIHVRNAGTSVNDFVEYGYYILSETTGNGVIGSQNNTITNCVISTTKLANTSTAGVVQNYVDVPTSASGTNSYNRYLNLKISNSINGIYVRGHAMYRDVNVEIGSTSAQLDFPRRFTVGADIPDDIGSSQSTDVLGIYVTNQEGVHIHDCDVRNLTTTNVSARAIGIFASNLYGTENQIHNNRIEKIRNNGGASATGTVYGIFASPPAGANLVRIYNNFVSNLNQSRTAEATTMRLVGIYVTQGNGGVSYVANNSVYLNPQTIGATNACIYVGTFVAELRNNILFNATSNQTIAKHYGIYKGGSTAIVSNTNDIYVTNSGNGFIGYHGSDCATLSQWQTVSGGLDVNSISADPNFVNAGNGDLHLIVGQPSPVNNLGTPLAWVTNDIDNAPRSNTNPDMGADEGAFTTTPVAPIISIAYDGSMVTITWSPVPNATSYKLYRSTQAYLLPAPSTFYSDLGNVTNYSESVFGEGYYFYVTAVTETAR